MSVVKPVVAASALFGDDDDDLFKEKPGVLSTLLYIQIFRVRVV